MTQKSGIIAQWGFVAESSTNYGNTTTVTKFLPFTSEKIKATYGRNDSKAIYASRLTLDNSQRVSGEIKVSGSISTELYDHGQGLLWQAILGGASITGANPYTQTFTPATLAGISHTWQIGRPSSAASAQAFTYNGVKVTKAQVKSQVGQIATLDLDIIAQNETTGVSLASASYPSTLNPYTFKHAAITVGGSSVSLKSFDLTIARKMTDRFFLGATTTSEPVENDLLAISGSMMPEFVDLTQYNRIALAQTASVSCVYTAGSNTLTISCTTAWFDGDTPNVNGRGILDQPLKLNFTGTNDGAAITVTTVNTDSSY